MLCFLSIKVHSYALQFFWFHYEKLRALLLSIIVNLNPLSQFFSKKFLRIKSMVTVKDSRLWDTIRWRIFKVEVCRITLMVEGEFVWSDLEEPIFMLCG